MISVTINALKVDKKPNAEGNYPADILTGETGIGNTIVEAIAEITERYPEHDIIWGPNPEDFVTKQVSNGLVRVWWDRYLKLWTLSPEPNEIWCDRNWIGATNAYPGCEYANNRKEAASDAEEWAKKGWEITWKR